MGTGLVEVLGAALGAVEIFAGALVGGGGAFFTKASQRSCVDRHRHS